jgi:hypothetical protein
MKPETEGKIVVALIVSLIAFGFGSASGIFMNISKNSLSSIQFSSNNQEIPPLVLTPNPSNIQNTEQPSQPQNSNNNFKTVYVENQSSENTQKNQNPPPQNRTNRT